MGDYDVTPDAAPVASASFSRKHDRHPGQRNRLALLWQAVSGAHICTERFATAVTARRIAGVAVVGDIDNLGLRGVDVTDTDVEMPGLRREQTAFPDREFVMLLAPDLGRVGARSGESDEDEIETIGSLPDYTLLVTYAARPMATSRF
jgi:hypothetical protein